MRNAGHVIRDLADHAPGHSLIVKLLAEWDAGRIRQGTSPGEIVIDEESRGWYWGVLGERKVAEILNYLGSDMTVLHSVPIGTQGADVDHLVIGPGGVFTINTKYHAGASIWTAGFGLQVNGTSRAKYLRSAAREAGQVENRLSAAAGFAVPVYPVLAFVDPASFRKTAPNNIDGVEILVTTADRILETINNRRELSDAQVARIAEVARDATTWQKLLRPSAPGEHLAREFDALREALGPALEPHGAGRVQRTGQRTRQPVVRTNNRTVGQRIAIALLGSCLGVLLLPILLFVLLNAMSAIFSALLNR